MMRKRFRPTAFGLALLTATSAANAQTIIAYAIADEPVEWPIEQLTESLIVRAQLNTVVRPPTGTFVPQPLGTVVTPPAPANTAPPAGTIGTGPVVSRPVGTVARQAVRRAKTHHAATPRVGARLPRGEQAQVTIRRQRQRRVTARPLMITS